MTKSTQLKALARDIEVIPEIVWRMQTPEGAFCMEWRSSEYLNPEKSAREYYADQVAKHPEQAAHYSIARVELLTDHEQACNTVAALLRGMAGGMVSSAQPVHVDQAHWAPLMGRELQLKVDPLTFHEIDVGRKTFEVRKDDRGFQCGDILVLQETKFSMLEMAAGAPLAFTGRTAKRRVIGILRGPVWGLEDGWVIMSVSPHIEAAVPARTFQERVAGWMLACFGREISNDKMERNHRYFEESTELVQANGMTRSEAHQLVDYTFDRPVGEIRQEAGGAAVTLAALCDASEVDLDAAAEAELERIWTKMPAIRAKQAAKPKHSPLPEHHESRV